METKLDRLNAFPLGVQFSAMLLLLLACSLLAGLLVAGLGAALGVDMLALAKAGNVEDMEAKRGVIRGLLLLTNGSAFLLPTTFTVHEVYRLHATGEPSLPSQPLLCSGEPAHRSRPGV